MSEQTAIVPVNTSISKVPMQSGEQITGAWRLAQYAAQSNLSKTKNHFDVMFIIQYGYELGLSAMASVRTIHVINGTPSCSGEAMLALIRRSKLASEISITGDATAAKCRMVRRDTGEVYEATFTIEEAREAGLTGKDNWKKFPAKMLKWRCVSEVGKFLFSDVIGGLYTIEEINPNIRVNESGDIMEGEIIHDEPRKDVQPVIDEKDPFGDESSEKANRGEKPADALKAKAWHEDIEAVKQLMKDCREKGWIEGDMLNKAKASFASLVGKEISDYESAEAAFKAAEQIATAQAGKSTEEAINNEGDRSAITWDTLDGINKVVEWAKGHGYGHNETDLLKLLGVADWSIYLDSRAACDAIAQAAKAKQVEQAAKPSEISSEILSEEALQEIYDWVDAGFGLSPQLLKDKIDLSAFQTASLARKMIRHKAKVEHWQVVADEVTYTVKTNGKDGKEQKYLCFLTEVGELRYYPGRTEFSKLVGEEFASANNIPDLPANQKTEIDPILLVWKSAENYQQVIEAMPMFERELA
jgi:hypothetical protein